MRNEKLYREAIEYAAGAEKDFLRHHEYARDIEDRGRHESYDRMYTTPAATTACAQQELIMHLFGVSEEKVHEDIHSLIEQR